VDKTTVKVSFTIYSDRLDHDGITQRLSINPTYIRYRTERLKNGRVFGHDEWGINTEYEDSYDIEAQLSKIVNKLTCKKNEIKELCKEFSAKCSFVVVVKVENDIFPSIGLTSSFMKFAGEIGADIGFDMYYF